ncbi:hypothetical protein [Streptomyces sp. CB03238]|uniref:hypothetical protein n=1 Tax=Streptomyces sp. CB03238 TaxID=1907777 RepID=UPI000A109859|nr:hypothetical protein [Streptomyces sp. CB03238]ORT58700.1 hypothetical protein BKD26_16055 [Streptomyces sp. CB03238]
MTRTKRLLAGAIVTLAVAGAATPANAATGADQHRPVAPKSAYVTGGPTTLSDNHAPVAPHD